MTYKLSLEAFVFVLSSPTIFASLSFVLRHGDETGLLFNTKNLEVKIKKLNVWIHWLSWSLLICLSQLSSALARVTAALASHATIFTRSTFSNSLLSRNSTSLSMNVQTLSQNLYVFNFSALKLTLTLTRVERALLMDLSNWNWKWTKFHYIYIDLEHFRNFKFLIG